MTTTKPIKPLLALLLAGVAMPVHAEDIAAAEAADAADTGESNEINYRGPAYQGLVDQSVRDVPGRTLVNAKIGWSNDNFGAYLFASNIFNDRYFDYQYDNDGRLNALYGDPRVIGLSFEGRF